MSLTPDPVPSPTGAPYDPTYDPLTSVTPGTDRAYAPTYWVATAGPPPADDGPITGDVDADVVIVGSGFTGLSCALSLARDHGIKATVLEANRVAWGCSTRNGGQGQNASGRLSRSQWIARYGRETALRLHAEILEGFAYFTGLVREFDPDPQPGGHIYVAHRPRTFAKLSAESEVANTVFGYRTRMLGADELRRDWMDEAGAVGALHEPLGIGIHPAKFAFGYLRAARAAGAKVHPASPVLGIDRDGGGFRVRTPHGTVRARAVAIATGGYTSQGLHPRLRSRIMPILSNSLVTRPLPAHPAVLLSPAPRRPGADRQPQRDHGGGRDPSAPSAPAGRWPAPEVPGPRGDRDRLFVVGLGRCQPRHDAPHRPARTGRAPVLRPGLRRQRRLVLGPGRPPARRAGGRAQARGPADLRGRAAGPPFAPFRRIGQRMLYRWYHHRDEAA